MNSKPAHILMYTAALSVVIWLLMSWPLPLKFASGIPSSAQNVEHPAWRYGIPGDHFQLLYYYELMHDMLIGRIPWFHNVYEFNTAGDDARFQPGAYFFPFSFVYSLIAPLTGNAAAWNIVQLLSVWFSAFFAWLWLRAFSRDTWAVALGVIVMTVIPFRWVSLFGGSPTGVALMWVPMLAWAVNLAVHRATYTSGALVGLSLALSYFTDLHVFFFCLYSLPLLFLISLMAGSEGVAVPWRKWYRVLPAGLAFGGVVAAYYLWRKSYLARSVSSGSRSWQELAIYSPMPEHLLHHVGPGISHKVYLGWALVVALAVAAVFVIIKWIRLGRPFNLRGTAFLLTLGYAAALVMLSLGVNGPWDARLLHLARDYVPYYSMIRQPAKIFSILMILLGWLAAVGWTFASFTERWRRAHRLLAAAMMLALIMEPARSVQATVSMLPVHEAAYEAVARDAEARGRAPGKVMVLPIWPGESADTSYPMYLVQQAGLRMINGYNPIVSREYVEEVFRPLQSMNMGWVTGEQLEFLAGMGVDYIVAHENMYPEKVSPFPVWNMLRMLDAHPRFEKMTRAESVHVYRILDAPGELSPPSPVTSDALFPTRRWEIEREPGESGTVVEDPAASLNAYWRASASGELRPWKETRPVSVPPLPDLAWMVRARGDAQLRVIMLRDGDVLSDRPFVLSGVDDWQWLHLPFSGMDRYGRVSLKLEVVDGSAELDSALLTAGRWPEAWPPQGLRIDAFEFFHSGYVDDDGRTVHFRRAADGGCVMYGPVLPLPPGTYRFGFDISTDAPDGTVLGWLAGELGKDTVTGREPVIAGRDNGLVIPVDRSLPVTMRFYFSRAADVRVAAVSIVREEQAP